MFNLVQRRRLYFIISGLVIGLGILAMIASIISTGAPFRLGVDFRSGTRYEVRFLEPVSEQQIRETFRAQGITNPSVTAIYGEGFENAWQIRTEYLTNERAQQIEAALANEIAPLDRAFSSVQSVSPAVGREVTRAAITAVLAAAILILFYIMFSFRQIPNAFRYGACAVAAMLHDILVITGFMAIMGMLLGWEADSLFLTAVLTIAGFSLQDTIVVFDRIRENLARRPYDDYETIANRSVLETIHRSVATQLTSIFVIMAILLFGGPSIRPFIAALLVGLFSGTYSSLFNAVPLLVAWEKGEIPLITKRPTLAKA
jgi:preprotein translocase SecF subunit